MPVFIRPIVPTSNKKQYVVAPDGSVLDVGLIPVSKDAKNLLTVDNEGLCVKASDIVSRSSDNMLRISTDGKLFISGTISPEISSDDYNYARIGRDGGLFISGNDILSNGDTNLLTIDPTDHKIILSRSSLMRSLSLVSTDKDNVISSGTDGGVYLAVDDLIAGNDPLLFINGDKQLATSIKLKYNPGNGALDLIGQNGDVITSVTVPTSTFSLKGVYLLNGKPDAMGATTAGDYHFSLQYSTDNGISWGDPVPVIVTATKGMESAGTLPGVEGVNKVRAFFHDLQAESIVSANKATLVFSDETKLTVTPGIEETTFTFMPAVGIETGVFLCFVFLLSDGTVQDVYVDLSTLVDVYAAGDGISITAGDVPIISAKVKDDGGVLVDSSGLHLDLNWINSHITAPTPDVNQGNGITVTDETGAVTVSAKPKENGGVTVDTDGISITIKAGGGILVDDTGIYVNEEWLEEHAPAPKEGNGISISGSTVSVKPNENGGIIVDNLGVAVNVTEGGGLAVDRTGVHIDESWFADNTFKPVEGNGIIISGSTISVKYKDNGGIAVDEDGLYVDEGWFGDAIANAVPEYKGATDSVAGIAGLVPPAAKGEQDYFLSGDGNWRAVHSTPVMVGATADTDGQAGIVPEPKAGQQRSVLVGNGSFQTISNVTGVINVKDFGAKGDGVTDDTEAFKQAFQRADTVFVPDGTYLVGDVDISRLSGSGVILYKTGRRVSVRSIALESKIAQTLWGDLYNSRNAVVQSMSICGKYIFTSQNTDGDPYTKTGVVKITQYEMPTEISDTWDIEVKGNLRPVAEASFTGFLGHGEGCSAVYGDDGEIYIYAQASNVYDEGGSIIKKAANGFSRIHWKGSSTTAADIETFYGLKDVQNAGQVSVTPDGKHLVIAFSKDTSSELYWDSAAANAVAVYDLKALVGAGSDTERENIGPEFLWVYKREGNIGVRSGVYCDGRFIYLMTSDAAVTGAEVVLIYDYSGTLIKKIDIDAFASIATKEFLYGTSSGMYPESKDAEGLCYHNESLYMVCKVNYARPTSFCRFHGKTYYAIADSINVLPTNSASWAPTLRDVDAEEWSSEKSYTGMTGSVPHKYLVAISPSGIYGKEYPVDITAWYHDVYSVFNHVGRANVVSGEGSDVVLGTLFKNFGSMLPYMSVTKSGSLYLSNVSDLVRTGNKTTFAINHSTNYRRTDIKAFDGIGEHAFIRLGFIDSSLEEPGMAFFSGNARRLYLVPDGTSRFYGDARPAVNNAYNLGNGANRWAQLYVASDAISTSDVREKQDVAEYPDEVLDAWGEVELRQFLFKDSVSAKGEAARIHAGVIAQQVVEAFEKHGLDATRYGLLCYDKWEDEYEDVEVVDAEAVFDAEGNEVTPAQTHMEKRLVTAAGDRYGIRYSEALCLEAAYQRRRAERIEKRLAVLESKIGSDI